MSAKKMLLFPGQGSQFVGMEEAFPDEKQVFECAYDILGYDLKKKIAQSTEEELSQTILSQPAILAVSLAALKSAELDFDYAVAGHSLGEYAALYACGVLDMENAFKAIKLRVGAICNRPPTIPGAMTAVLGLNAEVVEDVCNSIDDVEPVNYNSPQQIVIAGTLEALQSAEEALTAKGAKRAIRLNVSAAFHSKFMTPASEEFGEAAKSLTFGKPNRDFYSNVTGKLLTDFSDMPEYLAKHMRSPVRFTDEINAAKQAGIEEFIEIGPGKTLTGLVKKI
ncbi:MAG: ACP S-malonyltransferase [Oscillospiraceae bacterium]|nr:ACP S-malonyltransferase [Oscillospiraceae bacterium]